ncbi:hypothetical protein [Sulfurihydrogenibium yellowstonense]|jgi:hypothetical protein|uniref:Uncharacterized protein n=1 Tax=Sulfurihydrogenibium yellowstonense SS-5 TaxID=432331 RepID=C4FK83_9AQUI|nr:hypothetical protein [Sulfurihydrogenibium yellowstonense]EEP60514.1 hypothetical protein SULYE_0983 [Sulfurihydrogenibium yellowstonense SS-5]
MEKILEAYEVLVCSEEYPIFYHDKSREIWITGYKDGKKFDLFIKKLYDGTFKLIYEIPEERKVALFSDEVKLINRLKTIFEKEVVEDK